MLCNKIMNFICKKTLKRHFTVYHQEINVLNNEDRIIKFFETKLAYLDNLKHNETRDATAIAKVKASFIIRNALAKRGRPLQDGEFFKELAVAVLECFGNQGIEFSKIISEIPKSRRTIMRRIADIASFIYLNVRKNILKGKFYAIALEESTDVRDISQSIICVRTVNESFDVNEEIFCLCGLHQNATGRNIYKVVEERLFSFADKN